MVFSALITAFLAVSIDTEFYTSSPVTWSHLFSRPVITPLNNLRYNLSTSNLAAHGLHPWYQHILANLPLLLGPGFLLLFLRPHLSLRLYSAPRGAFPPTYDPFDTIVCPTASEPDTIAHLGGIMDWFQFNLWRTDGNVSPRRNYSHSSFLKPSGGRYACYLVEDIQSTHLAIEWQE
jgi:hypothetical protein